MWRELGAKTISFVTFEVFKAGEDRARAIVEAGNYRVATLSHGFHMGPLPEGDGWQETARAELSRAIRFASSVGAESIYMVTGGRGKRSWEEAAEIFAAAVAPSVAEAKDAGVPILIETAPMVYANMHLAHTLRDTIALAEMANIGVCIDLFSSWFEAGLRELIESALPITHLVQVGDYVRADNAFPCRAVPGDGDLPLAEMIEWIVGGGYRKSFDLELIGPRIDQEGLPAITRAARYVGDVLERLGG
jgi:sugar phosphate isomerase/epimerase